jgi:hypothetical protein
MKLRRTTLVMTAVAMMFSVQLLTGANVRAAQRDLPTATGGAVFSIIGTIIALPVKIATCGGMAVIGGAGYGVTLGESEFVQDEFLSALPDACRPVLKTTPMEIDPNLPGPRPQDLEW